MNNTNIKLTNNKLTNVILEFFLGVLFLIGGFFMGSFWIIVFPPIGIYMFYLFITTLIAPSQSAIINTNGLTLMVGNQTTIIPLDQISSIKISEYVKVGNPIYSLLVAFSPKVDTVIALSIKNPELANTINPKLGDSVSLIINSHNSKVQDPEWHLFLRLLKNNGPEIDQQLQALFPTLYQPSYTNSRL